MPTLRLNRVGALLAVCGALLMVLAVVSGGWCDDASTSYYTYRTPPLDPVTVAYRFAEGTTHPTAIACMKMLPDGAQVFVHRKCISGMYNGHVYIQEPDLSAGIRIDMGEFYSSYELSQGNLVTLWGEMATRDAERVVLTKSEPEYDYVPSAKVASLGMASPALMGWPENYEFLDGPRVTGLLPVGLYIRIWGQVKARDLADEEGFWYAYIDDGWGYDDGNTSGFEGVRVYCDRIPLPSETFMVATGVCSTKTYDPTPLGPDDDEFVIPVVRCTGINDLYPIATSPSIAPAVGPVCGTVRLVGRSAPGMDVRIYSSHSSIVVPNVTDTGSSFVLPGVRGAEKISASTPGYISHTCDAAGGDSGVELALQESEQFVELFSDRNTLRSCSSEQARVTVMLRDCEGKGMQGQVKVTTTLGSFVSNSAREIVLNTDEGGFADVELTAAPDGTGISSLRAEPVASGLHSALMQMAYYGIDVSVTADKQYLSAPGSAIVRATVVDGDDPVAQTPVVFRTDLGVFQATGQPTYSTLTDAQGQAAAALVLATPGTARVLVSHTNSCGQQTSSWVTVAYGSDAWFAQGVQYSNPLAVQLDGNGAKEIVLVTSGGILAALSSTDSPSASMLWSKTVHPTGSNSPSCAVMDADRSGLPCVFLPAENQQKVYAYSHDGRNLAGWPAGTNYRFIKVAASIGDMNLDGTPEILAGDECCYVFCWNPTGDWQATGTDFSSFLWRNLTGTPSTAIYGSTCALGELDGDPLQIPDLVVGTNRAPEVYAFPGDAWGDFMEVPKYLDGWPKTSHSRVETSPALGDMDGDTRNDIVLGADDGNVYIWLSSDGSWTPYTITGELKSSPALCDLDDDGKLDAVIGCPNGRVYALNWRGEAPAGWSGGIRLNWQGSYSVESSPTIGDVTGDGVFEVVVGCTDGNVYALYKDGINHTDNGIATGPIAWVRNCRPQGQSPAQVLTAPVIDDVDGDGKVEVVAAGDKGVYIFQFEVPYVPGEARYPWPTFHRDNERTGCATPPAAAVRASIQGRITQGGQPLARAKVYIYEADGVTPVMQPYSDPPTERGYVMSVGGSDPQEAGKGAYCISQLEPSRQYVLKVVTPAAAEQVIPVNVTVGLHRQDIDF